VAFDFLSLANFTKMMFSSSIHFFLQNTTFHSSLWLKKISLYINNSRKCRI
jgi:hypothetical protein